MAASVEDLAVGYAVLANEEDPLTSAASSIRGLRIGRVHDGYFATHIHPMVREALDSATGVLASAGATLVNARLPDIEGALHTWGDIAWPEFAAAYPDLDLDKVDWPESTKELQRNWIGKSEGLQMFFTAANERLEIFTTRPDTIFGATFMVLAPEHPLVPTLTAPEKRAEVDAYVEQARRRTEIDRLSTDREKTGVAIGADAINPINGERIPIFVADYVLAGYGTGAIMAVPAHDERDYAFAVKFGLPIRRVVARHGEEGTDLGIPGYESLTVSSDNPKVFYGDAAIEVDKSNMDEYDF